MLTPKPYLSWTQLDMFERSPEQYKRIYIDGGRVPINRGMALGKEVAESLETGHKTGNTIKDLLIEKLPKLDIPELIIETVVNGVPVKCVIDTASSNLGAFKEYKTGATPWDQKKADSHGQITFYCAAIQALTDKIPDDIELIWAPTKYIQGDYDMVPELTGEILRFKTKRTTADLLKIKVRIKKAWDGIKKMTEEELI